MRNLFLAAFAALSLGFGVAQAATAHHHTPPQQQGNDFNFTEGGGG